jgi:hypothetical protein
MGSFFGVFWGLFMLCWGWYWMGVFQPVGVLVLAVMAGVFFGLAMAGFGAWSTRNLRLPPWRDYPGRHHDPCEPI